MFCENCGKQIPDGMRLCDACGGVQPEQPAAQQPLKVPTFERAPMDLSGDTTAQSQNQGHQPQYQQPVWQEQSPYQAPQQPAFDLNMPAQDGGKRKKKKKGGSKVALIIIALLVVAGIVLAAINWTSILRFFRRTFAEPTDYLVEVEKENATQTAQSLAAAYDGYLENYTADSGSVDASVTVEMSDTLISLLDTALASEGLDVELDWVDSVTLAPAVDVYEDVARIDLGIGLNGVDVATVSAVWDIQNQIILVGVPELHDTYIQFDARELLGEEEAAAMAEAMAMSADMSEAMMEAMPTGSELETLVSTYYGILLDHVEDVEKESVILELDGLRQNATELTVEFSEKDLVEILVDVLKEAKDDEIIEDTVTGIGDYVNEMNAMNGQTETVDLYAEFATGLEYALEEMEAYADEASRDTVLTVETFLDSKDNIVGRTFTVEADGTEVELHYLTVTEGEKFAFEAEVEGMASFSGSGTLADGLATGEYTLEMMGTDFLTVEVEDLGTTENGQLSGTVRLIPESALYEMLELDSSTAGMLEQMSLELTWEGEQLRLGLDAAGVEMLGLILECSVSEPGPVSIPEGVSTNDNAAGNQWLAELDFEGVLSQLESAGVPAEYMDILNEYVAMFQEQFG